MSLTQVIEALLFSAQKPLSTREIVTAIKSAEDPETARPKQFSRVREAEVAAALEQLKIDYIKQERAFQLIEKAEGWQLATDPKYAPWVRQLLPAQKPARLSAPSRRKYRWCAANIDGARPGENRRPRRNPRASASVSNDTVFSRSLRFAQSR